MKAAPSFLRLGKLRRGATNPAYAWMLQSVKPYRRLGALTVLCGLLITIGEMAVPKFMQVIVDELLPDRNFAAMYGLVAAVAAIFLVTYWARTMRTKWQIRFSELVFRDVQLGAIRHFRKLGVPYFESRTVGDSLALMNADLPRIQGLLRWSMPMLLQDGMMAVVSFAFMASVHLKLVVCVLPAFLLFCLAGPFLSKRNLITNRSLHEQRSVRDRKAYESVSALAELRVNGASGWDAARYGGIIGEMHRRWTIQQLWVRARVGSSEFFYYIGAIFVFVFGAAMIRDGQLTIGAFMAFTFYFLFFIQTVGRIFLAWSDVEMGMQQVGRIYEFMREEPAVKETAAPQPMPRPAGDIELDRVSLVYPNGARVLNEVSLRIPAGAKAAIVGPTGNGKTTLLKLLIRFYDPSSGNVRIGGVPLQEIGLEELHRSVGYIFQETYMFGRTVKENILAGDPRASDERVREAAKLASIHDEIERMPNGYDSLVGERGIKLSGGQKQRIAIARLFLKDPQVVLLDEATSALDAVHEEVVQEALERLFRGRTVVSVVHRITAHHRAFDTIAVLDGGELAEQGTYDELLERKGLFYRLLHGQTER